MFSHLEKNVYMKDYFMINNDDDDDDDHDFSYIQCYQLK